MYWQVVDDILKQLQLRDPVAKFKVSCFRSNLFYDVVFKDSMDDPYGDLQAFALNALGIDWENDAPVGVIVYFHIINLYPF